MTNSNEQYIYSIGYGNRTMPIFLSMLDAYHIQYLIDVRSFPFSKWQPQFNRDVLKTTVNDTGRIKYGYMGDQLGGRPHDIDCYGPDGKVLYDIIRHKDYFCRGIERLVKANTLRITTCVLCSEADPKTCHRTRLIGEALRAHGIILQHICQDAYGHTIIKTQTQVMNEALKGENITDLFGTTASLASVKSIKS